MKKENDTTNTSESKMPRINIHLVFLALVVVLIVGIITKLSDWGVMVKQEDIFKDGMGSYDNSYDMMLPAFDVNGDPIYPKYDKNTEILVFGNDPFADDRDSKDNLANIIAKQTDATVYNCSISGSHLASSEAYLISDLNPMNAFNFYWLSFVAAGDLVDKEVLDSIKALGQDAPSEAMDVYNTLNSINLDEIDVICIMYDGDDYLCGSPMYSDDEFYDIETFTGSLAAGLDLIRENHPNIRFIIMSPTYAYGIDENGEYISSDIQTYGQHFLSTYVIKEAEAASALGVTFVDNLYGSIHEDNADLYLTDNIHLNVDGRKLVAQRFIKAMYYYNDRD